MTDREKVIKAAEIAIDVLSKAEEPTFWLDFVRCAVENALELLKEQEQTINELEEKLRLLEYGDLDTLQSIMMPAT